MRLKNFLVTPGLLVLCALCAATPAQQAPSQPTAQQQGAPVATTGTLSVTAKLVVVPTVVRDKRGAIVGNLTKDDFALKVDGKPQTLRYFDHENDTPLTIGLLVDTSRSQTKVLDDERTASIAFLQKMLAPASASRPSDKAFIVQFARDIELLQDVTDSRPKLQEGLKLVDTESPSFSRPNDNDNNNNNQNNGNGGNNGGNNRGSRQSGGGTALYDAVFLSSDEVIAKQPGRRALVLLTDGVDRNSKKSLASAIESAQRADTILYAIYFKGESPHENFGGPGGGHHGGGMGWPGGGGGYPGGGGGGYPGGGQRRGGGYESNVDGKKILERMCGETGGRVFEVKGKETVDAIYTEIGDELRAQYRLGFTPTADATAEGYHQIDLQIAGTQTKNKYIIQTRDGYYTGGK